MITVNCMIRDEPLAFYAIASVAPYVDEVLVVDTGSDPKYLEPVRRAKELFSNVVLHETTVANAHGWRRVDGETRDVDDDAGKILGDLRRCMHNQSKNPIVMILDGDEVYGTGVAEYVTGEYAKKVLDNPKLECGYVHFFDLLDKDNIRHIHEMGRIFKKDKVYIHSFYPHECHYSKETSWILLPGDERVICIDDNLKLAACHYEAIVKPWRKPMIKHCAFNGKHPEVFAQYHDLVKKELPEIYNFMLKNGLYETNE